MNSRDFRQNKPYGGACATCGKRLFLDRDSAKKAIRRMKGRQGKLRAYPCGIFWHIGHPPTALRGRITRDDIQPRRRP